MPDRFRFVVAAIAVASGCGDTATTPTPTAAPGSSAPRSQPSTLDDPARFRCATNEECTNSCAYGAVSAAWYTRNARHPEFHECQDGCNNQISAPPRCENGECVAYQVNPQNEQDITRSDYCTRVPIPRSK